MVDADLLASRVLVDWSSAFPDALKVRRANKDSGVPDHNPGSKLIEGITAGFIDVVSTTSIADIGVGATGPPGVAPPTPFVFPATPAAIAAFLTSSGWFGVSAPLIASIWVGSTLTRFTEMAFLLMPPNPGMAAGTGIVSAASNPGLSANLPGQLTAAITLRLQETNCFCAKDIPGGPLTPEMLKWIPGLASALSVGFQSISAQVVYAGASGGPPVTGVRNVGGFA